MGAAFMVGAAFTAFMAGAIAAQILILMDTRVARGKQNTQNLEEKKKCNHQ